MDIVKEFYDAERAYSTLPDDATEDEREKAKKKWLSTLADEDFVLTQSPDLPWGSDYHGQ